MHADLGSSTSQQCPPTMKIGACMPVKVIDSGAAGAEEVIKGIHLGVVLFADIT